MRSIAYTIALLLLNSAIFSQSDTKSKNVIDDRDFVLSDATYCPRTHVLDGTPEKEYWFEGTIRNSTVRIYLHRAGADVVGLFYTTDGDWTPTFLGGEWGAKGIKLLGESANEDPTGRLEVQLVHGALVGSWTLNGSDHADPVRASAVQKPVCSGSGVWKRFDDPKWPVSFSYPASWHLKKDDERSVLTLTCPDPEAMTWNEDVTIYEGKGKPVGPYKLVQCPKKWRFGPSCDSYAEDAVTAQVAEVSAQPGRTVLSLGHEWRVYCADGGYRGQGDGNDKVVLLRNYWVQFMGAVQATDVVDRMAKSAQMRAAHTAK